MNYQQQQSTNQQQPANQQQPVNQQQADQQQANQQLANQQQPIDQQQADQPQPANQYGRLANQQDYDLAIIRQYILLDNLEHDFLYLIYLIDNNVDEYNTRIRQNAEKLKYVRSATNDVQKQKQIIERLINQQILNDIQQDIVSRVQNYCTDFYAYNRYSFDNRCSRNFNSRYSFNNNSYRIRQHLLQYYLWSMENFQKFMFEQSKKIYAFFMICQQITCKICLADFIVFEYLHYFITNFLQQHDFEYMERMHFFMVKYQVQSLFSQLYNIHEVKGQTYFVIMQSFIAIDVMTLCQQSPDALLTFLAVIDKVVNSNKPKKQIQFDVDMLFNSLFFCCSQIKLANNYKLRVKHLNIKTIRKFNQHCQTPYKNKILQYVQGRIDFQADWFSMKMLEEFFNDHFVELQNNQIQIRNEQQLQNQQIQPQNNQIDYKILDPNTLKKDLKGARCVLCYSKLNITNCVRYYPCGHYCCKRCNRLIIESNQQTPSYVHKCWQCRREIDQYQVPKEQ